MATASSTAAFDLQDSLKPALAYADQLATALMQVQKLQLEALTCWQQSLLSVNTELWDEWVCRFAGGAPIDA